MKKRSLLMAASLVLALLVATTGTLAYLSDVDSDVNVMTLGNVKIEQLELQRAEGVAHNATAVEGSLVPFEQGQPLYPAYPVNNKSTDYTAETNDLFFWGPYVTAESDGTNGANGAGNGLWNPEKLVGAMDKFVFVKNTGSSDAYYRTWFAFECPEGMEYSQGPDKQFMMNVNLNTRFVWEEIGYTKIDGTRYLIMCATYQNKLAPGEISRPSLLQVVMTGNADNDDMALLGDTYEILVYSQAVQTTNFPDAETALNAAFGEPVKDNVINHPWLKDTTGLPVHTVANNDELTKAIDEGATEIYLSKGTYTFPAGKLTADMTLYCAEGTVFEGNSKLNINGATVVGATFSNPAGSAVDQTINGTFKNCTFTGSNGLRWCYAGETVVFENCVFSGDVYGVHFDGGANDVIFKNCTFSGFNAVGGEVKMLTMEDCTFKANGKSGYNGINLWGNTEMTNCTFIFDGSVTYEWVDMRGDNTTGTFTNCTISDGEMSRALTASDVGNYGTGTTVKVQ